MDLRRLEIFLEVLDKGSFGAAARALGMTQSGLTKSVQTLEDTVGAPIDIVSTGPDRVETIVLRNPFGD